MGSNQYAKWEEVSADLNRKAIEEHFKQPLEVGQSLTFSYEGSPVHYKIMALPKNGKIYWKRIYLTDASDFDGHMGHAIDSSEKTQIEKGGPWCMDCEALIGSPQDRTKK